MAKIHRIRSNNMLWQSLFSHKTCYIAIGIKSQFQKYCHSLEKTLYNLSTKKYTFWRYKSSGPRKIDILLITIV